jgi:hypothetical protein
MVNLDGLIGRNILVRMSHYCDCVGRHKPGCPNAGVPDALPPLGRR